MDNFTIDSHNISPGESRTISIPVIKLYTGTQIVIPVYIKHGKRKGPIMFINAALHGDELNGIEIISRIIHSKTIKNLKGTLLAVPMVNTYGVLNKSRYLPDRRDLNRSFPGSQNGSLAGRVAHLFLQHIVKKSNYGIDLHTGARHRNNLPQIRANLQDNETLSMAKSFGVPVLLNSDSPDGSLRYNASILNVKILLYEGGEALRFDEVAIRAGYRGIINVMRHLGMISQKKNSTKSPFTPVVARNSGWIRATGSGFVTYKRLLGDHVTANETLALIKDSYGTIIHTITSHSAGIIIGKQNIPLVQEGEAMYHIAYFKQPNMVAKHVEKMHEGFEFD